MWVRLSHCFNDTTGAVMPKTPATFPRKSDQETKLKKFLKPRNLLLMGVALAKLC